MSPWQQTSIALRNLNRRYVDKSRVRRGGGRVLMERKRCGEIGTTQGREVDFAGSWVHQCIPQLRLLHLYAINFLFHVVCVGVVLRARARVCMCVYD